MKNVLIALAVAFWSALITFSCSPSSKSPRDTVFTVTGSIRGLDAGQVEMAYFYDGDVIRDTASILNGVFTFHGKVPYPQAAFLMLPGADRYQEVSFVLDNGTTQVKANQDSLSDARIFGTAAQDEYVAYNEAMKSFRMRMNNFNQAYEQLDMEPSTDQKVDSLMDVYERIISEKLLAIKEYVRTHPESFVAAIEVINNFSNDPNADQLDSIYGYFTGPVKESAFGKQIAKMLDIAKKTRVGQVAPDFTLNDANGKPQTLSSLRGKVLLIDFWASWCGPCREENPNLVAAYARYHNKGFEVLGVSLDSKKEKWLEAIKEDELAWNHVSDLQGWNSAAATLYGVNAIPMSYLLDKDGKIIAKNLRGGELTKKLDEVLK